jgi:hypothetical protein
MSMSMSMRKRERERGKQKGRTDTQRGVVSAKKRECEYEKARVSECEIGQNVREKEARERIVSQGQSTRGRGSTHERAHWCARVNRGRERESWRERERELERVGESWRESRFTHAHGSISTHTHTQTSSSQGHGSHDDEHLHLTRRSSFGPFVQEGSLIFRCAR